MSYVLHTFKAVTLIFAVSAVGTGLQGIVDPVGFSKSFGLSTNPTVLNFEGSRDKEDEITPRATAFLHSQYMTTMSYISLMGVRQLATGVILLVFAYQRKWTEAATILAIIGILVAGIDGIYLSRAGLSNKGLFHAIPGGLISVLACGFLWRNP